VGEVADQLLPCCNVSGPSLVSLQWLHRLLRHLHSAGVEQLGVALAESLSVGMTVLHGHHHLAQDPLHTVTDVRQRRLFSLLPVPLRPPRVGQTVGGRQLCDLDAGQVCREPGELQSWCDL